MDRIKLHKDITDKMHEVYVAKNKDYGDSVHDTYGKYGMVSFIVRMEDKLSRLNSLTINKKHEVKDETIEDTLLDLANYAVLAIIEIEREKESKKD